MAVEESIELAKRFILYPLMALVLTRFKKIDFDWIVKANTFILSKVAYFCPLILICNMEKDKPCFIFLWFNTFNLKRKKKKKKTHFCLLI